MPRRGVSTRHIKPVTFAAGRPHIWGRNVPASSASAAMVRPSGDIRAPSAGPKTDLANTFTSGCRHSTLPIHGEVNLKEYSPHVQLPITDPDSLCYSMLKRV